MKMSSLFDMNRTFFKSWYRFCTSSVIVICVVSFFILSQYTSNFPLSNYAITVIGEGSNGSDFLSLKIPNEAEPRMAVIPRWTYKCKNKACIRTLVEGNEQNTVTSFEVCWLTCGSHGPLWPFPAKQKVASETVKFLPENIHVEVKANSYEIKSLLTEAFEIKLKFFENHANLKKRNYSGLLSYYFSSNEFGYKLDVIIEANDTSHVFTLGTDETYQIKIAEKFGVYDRTLSVLIRGNTFFGVRHGIETFSQLIGYDETENCFQIVKNYEASDGPSFTYRGILIDSARNFIPMSTIKSVVDGMSYNKLNVLHWHLSDSNSFTFHSKRVPQMTQYGAIGDKFYKPHEIAELVRYARVRGVKILPELDAPSHAGNGWQFGEKYGLGKLAYYINEYSRSWHDLCGQPPCGILNPINVHTYDILEAIYADMLEVFDQDLFHMGGDEVNLGSWSRIPELRQWLEGKSEIELWKFFQIEALKRLKSKNTNVSAILWTSKLTANELRHSFLNPKDYIIQVWESSSSQQVRGLLRKGFSLILSFVDALYLDWGGGTWLGRNHIWDYHYWQKIYDVEFNHGKEGQVLGGEAPLWGEKVSPYSLEGKLWPRASALAEKLWSNPNRRGGEVYTRLNYQVHRMEQRKIPVGFSQPYTCLHFHGHCSDPSSVL